MQIGDIIIEKMSNAIYIYFDGETRSKYIKYDLTTDKFELPSEADITQISGGLKIANGGLSLNATAPTTRYIDVNRTGDALDTEVLQFVGRQGATTQSGINIGSNTTTVDGDRYAFIQAKCADATRIKLGLNHIGGNVGIGKVDPAYQLELSTDSAGKPTTDVWTIVSDERIKENIELADLDRCYEIVKELPLKHYRWKYYTDEQAPDRSMLGWIA
jgi:hypothetical protein